MQIRLIAVGFLGLALSHLETTATTDRAGSRIGSTPIRSTRDSCTGATRFEISAFESIPTPYGVVGFHIDKPGCYTLVNDLDVSSFVNFAILSTAGKATLDLNGHTIRDLERKAIWLVRVISPERVVVRNGTLQGGEAGMYVTGDAPDRRHSQFRLESIDIKLGPSSTFMGLRVSEIDLLHITNSMIRGVDVAAVVNAHGGQIENSVFRGIEVGLDARNLHGGRVMNNTFHGDFALSVGSRNFVGFNSLEGRYTLEVVGDRNQIRENAIKIGEVGISILSSGNRVIDNNITGSHAEVGIEVVFGDGNLIEGNHIVSVDCGLTFHEAGSNSYKKNVVESADEGVCGEPNQNAGGNTLPPSTCGNDIRGGDEACDTKDLSRETCESLGFFAGRLFCDDSCEFDTSRCHNCGNVILDEGEECDTTNLNGESCSSQGFDGGTLSCDSSSCELNATECTTNCGDGVRRGLESCDGLDLSGNTCLALGFDEGSLACSADCGHFDLAGCGFVCGNDSRGATEACDGADLGESNCQSLGFDGGILSCSEHCTFDLGGCSSTCGDGVRRGLEQCDGLDFGDATCLSHGFDGGILSCFQCLMEFSSCTKCGNEIREGTEICDGSDLGGETCETQGQPRGVLVCSEGCDGYEYSRCSICGNGVRESEEFCDGTDVGTETCRSQGRPPGILACNSLCTAYDYVGCDLCGNNLREGDETCDGTDLGGETCQTQGKPAGALACNPLCTGFNYSGCQGFLMRVPDR